MGVFFIYILKSSVCLVLFYLFFRLLLSKETFHRFNRMALLGVLFFSLLIPCIEVTTRHQVEVQQAVLSIEQLLLMAELEATPANVGAVQETPTISWVQIVLLVYLAGILFLVCRNIYSLICLFRLVHSGKHEKLEKGVTLVVHNQEIAPFSWMKYIVISRKDLEENGREILIHEMAHIHHRHLVDLLVADICIFFQWFNPGAWLLKQELQNIHEYEADETVINEGVNAKEYQLLLIKKAVGTRLYSMANSFNHSKLKKRVMVGFTVAETGKIKDVRVLQSDEASLNQEAERIVSEMPDWIPGKQRGRPVPVKYTVPIRFGNIRFAENKQPLIFADGKEISMDAMEKLDPSTIESISVLKDSTSIKVYGKRGANGVILVNTQRGSKTKIQNKEISFSQKTTSTDAVPDFPVSGTVVDEQGRPKAGVSIIVPNTNHGTITDINGHFSLKAMKDGNLWFSFIGYKPVKASVSSTMNIRMEQEVVDLFPELSGSVKNGNSGFKVNNGVTVHGIKGEEPLVIIDGKEAMEKDALSKLAPDHIKSISVLKDKSAQVVYGDKGKNGVIIVEMLTDDEYQARQNKR